MDFISAFDIIFCLILLGSMAGGFARGFLRELTGLVALYVSIAIAAQYNPVVTRALSPLFTRIPYYVLAAIVYLAIVGAIAGLLNFVVHTLLRPGVGGKHEPSDLSQIAGLAIAAVEASAFIAISIPALRYATSASWGTWDGTREAIQHGLDTSYLLPFFSSLTPWVLWLISPLLPGGIPDVLRGRLL